MKGKEPVKSFVAMLVFLLTVVPAACQTFAGLKEPQPTYRNFSVARGLPSSETYFVHQDRKGFIWICTDRGVARYDGYRFRIFTKKDGLTDDVVFRIYEDHKGRLWFITYNGLLCYWENDRIHPYKYNNRIREYLKNDITTFKSFSIDRNDNVLFSASLLGPVSISASGKLKYLFKEQRKKGITFLVRNGKDWFVSPFDMYGQRTQILKIEGNKKTFTDIRELASSAVYTATNGKQSFLQINNWVISIDASKLRDSVLSTTGICCDEDYLWRCTANGAIRTPLSAFGRHKKADRRFLDGHFITWVLKDRQGGYWFSTLENGVYYTPDPEIRTYKKTPAGYANIADVIGNGKDVYYADKANYYRLNAPYDIFSSPAINKRAYFVGDRLCFNDKFLADTVVMHYPGENILRISDVNAGFVTSDNRLLVVRAWIGRMDRSGKLEVLYYYFSARGPHKQHFLHAISQDASGRIYVGNTNGLFELRNRELWIDAFRDKRFRVRVSDLDYHPDWKNIVATRGIGIYCFENDRITIHLTEKEGLLDNQINRLFVDRNGVIWACTNKGVNRISRQNGKIVVERITLHHGLPSNEINSVYAFGGKVWIATRKGLAMLADRPRARRSKAGLLDILHIETDREKITPIAQWFIIAPGREYIKILLRSTNFRTGVSQSVRYRFEAGGKWLTANTGELLIPKPAPGNYVLEVRCQDENGYWSETKLLSRFRVEEPFYGTWYFIGGMILFGLGMIYLLFRLRIRQINRRNQLQKTINSLEQKALRAQMNPHFIFNSLNSIQSFLIYEENEKAEKYLLRFARLIRQTLNNSRESYIAIESEMETLRGYLELEQMRFKEKFTFEITCGLSAEELQWGVPPMLIQPFVENAVLHGFKTMESGGRIEVRFERLENQRLLCVVEDNGIGRRATMSAKPEGHKSFGTKITEERLAAFRQKYGDEFSIETIDKDENGQAAGTKVVMHIPVVGPGEINLQEEG